MLAFPVLPFGGHIAISCGPSVSLLNFSFPEHAAVSRKLSFLFVTGITTVFSLKLVKNVGHDESKITQVTK